MKAKVIRQGSLPEGTHGRLVTERAFCCDTLELGWHGNQRGISCIKADTYAGEIWFSPTLQRQVVRLEDKHGRQDCLIHNGNLAGDIALGMQTQVHGCTEVGQGYGLVQRPDKLGLQLGVLSSKDTLAKLIEHLGEGPHEITYEWAPGCAPTADTQEG